MRTADEYADLAYDDVHPDAVEAAMLVEREHGAFINPPAPNRWHGLDFYDVHGRTVARLAFADIDNGQVIAATVYTFSHNEVETGAARLSNALATPYYYAAIIADVAA